ncbi:MAG: exonuclease domain-containing protein [Alphaproteobacteria bacterium]
MRVSRDVGLKETAAFMALVQPTLNPVLSDYLIDLTGITNADIARAGVPNREGLDGFAEFVGALPILTHGRDDVVIVEECAEKNLDNPPIRAITERQLMSSELPAHFGLAETGRTHDALADARALVLAHLQR